MKLRRIVAMTALALVVLACAGIAWAMANAETSDRPVGFQVANAGDGTAMPIAIWYPTTALPRPTTLLGLSLLDVARGGPVKGNGLPLVVISHGNGGGPASHADLAMVLASAGYVVAAPMHAGDNYLEQDGMGKAGFWAGRNAQLRMAVDFMVRRWSGRERIDATRIGAFGFSAGGFTVLSAAGAVPDLGQVARHCAETPEFVCTVLEHARSPLLEPGSAEEAFGADPRIRAIVIAAPGLGFTMARPGSLSSVTVPVQLWAGGLDDRVPVSSNVAPLLEALPGATEYHLVPKAGHIAFLAPCRILRPAELCRDAPGFDRAAFHEDMNHEVFRFFDAHLRK